MLSSLGSPDLVVLFLVALVIFAPITFFSSINHSAQRSSGSRRFNGIEKITVDASASYRADRKP